MGHIQGVNRHEVICFPERLDDYIAEDNPVRFIDAFVDELDLVACGFQRAVPAATGRPGYAPGDLLKLYLYGYLYRLRSSRRLEQETHRNVALLWLLKKLRPDHKTIADFRKNNLTPLRQVCRTFTLLCKQLDLFGAELVAIDGSKFRAVNAKERHFTPDKLTKLLAQIDERVAAYLKELDRQDTQEAAGTSGGAVAEHLQAKIEALQQRKLLYEGFQAHLEARGETPLSLTAPESRAMKLGKGRGPEVCYNVQTAVDSKHKLIIANDVVWCGATCGMIEAQKPPVQECPMRTKVTEHGVLIPKALLEGIDEVDIQKAQDMILVVPVQAGDPILNLGKQPIRLDVEDASVNHDRYLYDR